MKIEFKDVAHLYLGVEVVNTIGKHMGKIVSVSIDGTATINPLDEFKPRVIILNSLKPILRPLSDMSNDEIWKLNEITKAGSWNLEMIKNIKSVFNLIHATPIVFLELTKLNFDLFDLIESGEAINKAKLSQNTPNQ
mgnify:CR=1 FL=1